MTAGEMFIAGRRPSIPGSNQQILFNQQGVEGTDPAFTFDYANNNLTIGATGSAGNLNVTQNTITGNLSVVSLMNVASLNVSGTENVSTLNVSGWFSSMDITQIRGQIPTVAVINTGGIYLGTQNAAVSNTQAIELFVSNSSIDNGWWEIIASNTGSMIFRTANDSYANVAIWMQVNRQNANSNIGGVILGNQQDNPQITIFGDEVIKAPTPVLYQITTQAVANGQLWNQYPTAGGKLQFEIRNDNQSNVNQWLVVQRIAGQSNLINIQMGNPNDSGANVNVFGNVVVTSNVIAQDFQGLNSNAQLVGIYAYAFYSGAQ